MSAWVIALGLGAGYLINKNLTMGSRLKEKAHEYKAKPSAETEEIREVQRAVPIADKYQDMNLQDLSKQKAEAIAREREAAHQRVAAYEAPALPEIQGVYLAFDSHGV